MIKRLLTWQWILTTLLAILAMGVMVRLGIWQLDRLAQRQRLNASVLAQQNAPVLTLDEAAFLDNAVLEGLKGMEYRTVVVRGVFDPTQQVVLRNQGWNQQFGVHLLTPLRIENSAQSILVDRGWVPEDDFTSGNLGKYDQPGVVEIQGVLRSAQIKPDIGSRTDKIPPPGQGRLDAWYMVNLTGMAQQMPYPLLPVYIQQAPGPEDSQPPYASLPVLDLTEGPHLGYAVQWFLFATILGVGYPFFVRKELLKEKNTQAVQS